MPPAIEGAMGTLLPAGSASFDLPVAGIRVRILDLPTPWQPFVAEHYEPFVESPRSDLRADLTIRCREGSGLVIPLPEPGATPVLDVKAMAPRRFSIRSHWQEGHLDLGRGEGELVLTDRTAVPFRMSLENFLRVACQLLLTSHDAFLLHSAGILEAGRCFLLFGPSGAGKSTSASLSMPRRLLSDDMVAIDVGSSPPLAHAVPFFGAFPMRERERGAFPVAAALRLRQAPEDRIDPLGAARAAATVSASVPFVHELGLRHETLPDLVVRFCAQVPVCDLHFTRSARFWDLLKRDFSA